MSSAWSQTVASTIANQGTKFEYGFSAYYSAGSREIELDGAIVSASVGCGTGILQINIPEMALPSTIDPLYGTVFTVGNFHTHPPLTYCPSNHSIVPGPSSLDMGSTTNYPRIVRTYINTVSGGHDINLSTADYFTNYKINTDY